MQSEERRDSECLEKLKTPHAQQVQVTYLSHTGHHVLSESEEPEADQHPFQQNLPTSVTSVACKSPLGFVRTWWWTSEGKSQR